MNIYKIFFLLPISNKMVSKTPLLIVGVIVLVGVLYYFMMGSSSSAPSVIPPSPSAPVVPTPIYVGCYPDNASRALPTEAPPQTVSQCNITAKAAGSPYFGMQYWPIAGPTPGTQAQCFYGNPTTSLEKITSAVIQADSVLSCAKGTDGKMLGGAWSNAIYKTV